MKPEPSPTSPQYSALADYPSQAFVDMNEAVLDTLASSRPVGHLDAAWETMATEIKAMSTALRTAEALEQRVKKVERELERWQRPFDQERFDACKQQASHKDSLAAQGVYITALEHALKHAESAVAKAERERDDLRLALALSQEQTEKFARELHDKETR